MNREIKFRAWDGGRMSEPFDIFSHHATFNDHATFWDIRSLDACNIMQFTGLQDKNGKDIYEGDIARFYACPEEDLFFFGTAEMVWSEPCFVWKPIECLNEFGFEFLDSTCFWNDDFETIGSIHENPELLK